MQDSVAQTISLSELDAQSPTSVQFEMHGADPWIGRELEHYKIVEPLGRGGMGQVYRALDQSLQRYVAVKVIRTGNTSIEDSRQLRKLFQEATAQARVNHPNIAHIYYVGRHSEAPFLAMELVDGQTLADEIAAEPMEFSRIVAAAIQIADALRHAIDFDIVHGDIKPSNILISRHGDIKLADFGLARRMSEQRDSDSISGTPQYLAPEISAGEAASALSDIYSLGVTLFQLTFGRMPYTFSTPTVQGLMQTHRESAIEFPRIWPPELPLRWREILEKMLAKSPSHRHQNYLELIRDLESVRPVALPHAGRVQRGLAWLVDMALVNTPAQLIVVPVIWSGIAKYFFAFAFVGAIVPLLAGMMQARWETTPGKKLFQIRIVDRHGLVPGKATLATRMIAQMLPVWAGVLGVGFQTVGAEWLFWVLVPIAWIATLIDIAISFVRADRRTGHDLIFGTRVALDTSGPANIESHINFS
jgi:uncharacterized RDD family membrane protein YckC